MTKQRFRSLPLRETPSRVDREQRVIYGVSAAQAVEALGHGLMLDQRTIEQIVALGNATKNGVGIKSRYTHPGLSSNGMGKQLGRMRNFRVEGDKAVGDLYLHESASHTPSGDLASHVMDLADEDPGAFGMSIVASGELVWTRANGAEQNVGAVDANGNGLGRPDDALTELPVFRVTELDAVDVVDEPAANRDGMFSRALWGTNVRAEQMFGTFDQVLDEMEMTPQQAWDYALKYFDARGVNLKGFAMSEEANVVTENDEEIVVAVEVENEERADAQGDEVTQEEAKELQAKLAAFEQREQEALAQAAALSVKIEAMEKEARTARFNQLARSWQGEIAKHVAVLEALGEGSEAFAVYCTQMDALSEQIEQGELFSEKGRNPKGDSGASVVERVNKLAMARAQEKGVAFGVALGEIFQEQSDLYDAYRAEAETKVK